MITCVFSRGLFLNRLHKTNRRIYICCCCYKLSILYINIYAILSDRRARGRARDLDDFKLSFRIYSSVEYCIAIVREVQEHADRLSNPKTEYLDTVVNDVMA